MKYKLFTIPVNQLVAAYFLICCCAFNSAPPDDAVFVYNTKADMNDSAKAIKSITGFLQWYKTNLHKVNAFPLIAKDAKGYYMIDKKACTAYLDCLHGSNFMAPKYFGYWQTFFDDKATLLKKEKIKDDIPENFDMDFILITQEPELVLNKISKLRFHVISMNNKVALIGVKLPSDKSVQYEFEMYNGKAGWQIGYISTPNFD